MMTTLYKSWGPLTPFIAVLFILILELLPGHVEYLQMLLLMQFPVNLIQQYEEQSYPGRFRSYINGEVYKIYDKDVPLNDVNSFFVNVPLIWVLVPLFLLLGLSNLELALWIPFMGVTNFISHISGVLLNRKYHSGVWIATFVKAPLSIYTLLLIYRSYSISVWITILSIAIALLTHLYAYILMTISLNKYKQQQS